MANEIAKKTESELKIASTKITDFYIHEVASLNTAVGVPLTDESKRCATNVLVQLLGEVGPDGVQAMPKSQLINVLQFVTVNGLDVFSGQVFLDKRKDRNGNIASIKATPMGNAYEIMTARFGVNVKTVHPARIVHEGDEFELPQFDGLKMTNVKHKLTLKGLDAKAIAVYYIIEKLDGTLDFAIATRESVAKNLMAQILNATLRDASVNRNELMEHLANKTLDELLSDKKLEQWISPAYRSPATREQMIITKMKKNALLHYTRDLGTNNDKAYTAVNSKLDNNDDMVVASQDADEPSAPTKISNFEIDDDGVAEQKEEPKAEKPAVREEKPAKPTENVVEAEVVKQASVDEPKQKGNAEVRQGSIFDTTDL